MKRKNKFERKAVVFGVSIFISTMLILSSIVTIADDERGPASYIVDGNAVYCNGGNADGATVLLTPSSGSPATTTVGPAGGWPSGYWNIEVGSLGGLGWQYGTTFDVLITISGWSGSQSGFTVVDDGNDYTGTGTTTLDPTSPLVATASADPTTIVAGETVDFTGSATGGATPYSSWFWDFDGAGTSNQQNPQDIVFSNPGIYDCVLTVTDSCSNVDSDYVTITVNAALSCDAGGPYSGTVCSPVSFSGSASGGVPPYSYSWTFGDSGSGSGQNPSHQYTSDGTYTATLTVTDSQSTVVTDPATVTISTSALVADADGPYSGTICDPVVFSGSASGGCSPYSYSWDFGDSGSGSGQITSHQYLSDGTYTVTLTVTDDFGSIDDDTSTVTISTTDVIAEAGGPYEGNQGDPIEFSGSAIGGCSPYTYSWDFGDSGSGSGQNPSHTYSDPGVYTVTLTVTDDAGQIDSDTATCTVLETTVIADAGGPYYGNVGESVTFSGSASDGVPPYNYNWDFGDGNTGTGQNPTHVYEIPNEAGYDVVLYVTDSNSNNDYDYAKAYISGEPPEDPTALANGPYSGIINQPISFTGSAFGGTEPYSWEWDFGDGETSTEQNPSHSYTSEGTYDVTLTVIDDNDKTDTDETTATITVGNPDLSCTGSLSWSTQSQATVTGSFMVSNIGDTDTNLDWKVDSFPNWGSWTFDPDQGDDLTPEAGAVTVEVTVVAPKGKAKPLIILSNDDTEFSGKVKVINNNNPSDFCEIPVSLTVPKTRPYSPMLDFLELLSQQMPMLRMVLEILQII